MIFRPELLASSSIVKDIKEYERLQKWVVEVKNTNVKFELLWKGTRDDFKAATFHSKCDKKGPTLTVIKSEHDKVFGGFTSESWGFAPPGKDQCKRDPTAFIYS